MNLNKAQIIGNLTRDPEIRNTPTGVSVATFSIATNYVWTDQSGQKQEKVEFHNIVAWRRLAEISAQYLRKGSRVYIEGRLQTRDWVGQDGVKRYRTEIITENMIMLDRAPSGQGARSASPIPAPMEEPMPSAQAPEGVSDPGYTEEEIRVENIPF